MSKITLGVVRGTGTGNTPVDTLTENPLMTGVASGVGDLGASFVFPLANIAGCDSVTIQMKYGVAATPVGVVWFFASNRVSPAAITVSGTSVSAHVDWTLVPGQGSGIAIPVAAAAPGLANTPAMYTIAPSGAKFLWLCGIYLRTSGGAADLMNAYILGTAIGGNI